MAIPGGGLPEQTEMAIPGGMPEKTEMAIPGNLGKNESPGNCHLRVPTRRYGYQNVQNFGANNFGFRPQS